MPEFERILENQLRQVRAPGELWARVDAAMAPAAAPPQTDSGYRIRWVLAAAAMLLLAVGTLWQFTVQDPRVQVQRAALREAGEHRLDLHTGNCAELRDWLKHNADLDIPIPEHPGAELLGARIIQRPGARIAAIAYRIAGGAATLFVARRRGSSEGPHHAEMQMASFSGGELISWSMRDKVYAMVSAGGPDLHAGCRLCHVQ